MDTREGYMELADNMSKLEDLKSEFPNHGGIFRVGEIVEIRSSRFRICKITPKKITLRVLPSKSGPGNFKEAIKNAV